MPIIRPFGSYSPQIASDVFVANNATIIGEVRIGSKSSIWYQTVLRGDVGGIFIGETDKHPGCGNPALFHRSDSLPGRQ